MPPLLAIDAVIFPFTPDTKAGVYADTPVLPWEREMNSVAWKHPNVYTGADCCHPRDWPADLADFIKGPGRDKVMWGTNKPVIEFADSLAGIDDLGLDEQAKAMLLRENVRRVYRL